MFDLPVEDKTTSTWSVDLPLEERDWNVGMIVGPSGTGKTTLARHLWPDALAARPRWSPDRSLLDDFPDHMGIRDVVGLLNAVGLGSPPAWMRPYTALSNGEAFRASIARALADNDGLVVVDEFTSVVDRQVARVASHTVQKTVRRAGRQFIAISCHYDVTDWLQPDWVYDIATASFGWRQVQPHPRLDVAIHRADRAAWPMFARHHYLTGTISTSAKCFVAAVDDTVVAFASYRHFPHPRAKNIMVSHRVVVLPDWQGLGIAGRISEWLGQTLNEQGYRFRATTAHPARIAYYLRSPRWRADKAKKSLITSARDPTLRRQQTDVRRLSTRSFEYVPPRA